MVLYQLHDVRVLFDRPPVHRQMLGWVRRLIGAFAPGARTQNVNVQAASGSATGLSFAVARGATNIEDPLAAVQQEVADLRALIDRNYRDLVDRIEGHRAHTAEELTRRQAEQTALASRLEGFAVGDLNFAFSGVLLTAIGLICAASSIEMERLLA